MCSNNQHLQNETKHLKKVFRDINGYRNCIIEQKIEKLKNQNEMPRSAQLKSNTEENEDLLVRHSWNRQSS